MTDVKTKKDPKPTIAEARTDDREKAREKVAEYFAKSRTRQGEFKG